MVQITKNLTDLSFVEVVKANRSFTESLSGDKYKIFVLSNIIVNQLKDILEYQLRSNGIPAYIDFGNYDNIIQDSNYANEYDLVIVFWDLSNIFEGIQHEVEFYSELQIDQLVGNVKNEMELVFSNLKIVPLVIFNSFSAQFFASWYLFESNLEKLAAKLNNCLTSLAPDNSKLINLDKILTLNGSNKSFDSRFFYSSKAPYSVDFLKEYAEAISYIVFSINGKTKKVIILDCDNTLWKGILGEDGWAGIKMSPATPEGAVFHEVQNIILKLHDQGVLICLCSKNNPEDVMEVIKRHKDMQLKEDHISIIKANWNNKDHNIREIAEELNLGLESFVFVDDSDFEINLVRSNLPEVVALQVPKKISEYPDYLRQGMRLFYSLSSTIEDRSRAKMYVEEAQRSKSRKNYSSIEDYLRSLNITISIVNEMVESIPRLSQMTQKTNQFNLTTKRYTENQILSFINNEQHELIAISVRDSFGDNGITGLCMLSINDQEGIAEIDTLLMSCRIIGRNIEFTFMDHVVEVLKKRKVKKINAMYSETPKNSQVKDLYKQFSFKELHSNGTSVFYTMEVDEYQPFNIGYIKLRE